jgi:hypothetical protein
MSNSSGSPVKSIRSIFLPLNSSGIFLPLNSSGSLSCHAGDELYICKNMMMMMMFIGTETLVTQLVHEISRMQAC